jgi:hypothetical protein
MAWVDSLDGSLQKKIVDTKVVIRRYKLKNRQYKDQKTNDGQLGMPATDTIILAASQICYKLSPGLHYNNVDSKQNLLCFTRLFTI